MESICETSPSAMKAPLGLRKRPSTVQLILTEPAGLVREKHTMRLLQLLLVLRGVAADTGRHIAALVKLYLRGPPRAQTWVFGYDYAGKRHYDQPMVILSFRSPLSTTVVKAVNK